MISQDLLTRPGTRSCKNWKIEPKSLQDLDPDLPARTPNQKLPRASLIYGIWCKRIFAGSLHKDLYKIMQRTSKRMSSASSQHLLTKDIYDLGQDLHLRGLLRPNRETLARSSK